MAALSELGPHFDVETFLAGEQRKDLLRFSTAGSVDDGKSTLIGRLLYDSRNVYEDQIHSVTKASVNRAAGPIDFSLLTDGLRAEREQGITIDVAYRYFSTARRKFIIADTPGHEQYTRNMATGASTADLAIILIDARKGVLPQSRRHAYIASLLGIRDFIVAVNKMDLVDYDQDIFDHIRADFTAWKRSFDRVYFLPISALEGDNVVSRSTRMPWFEGPSLLEYLETVEVRQRSHDAPFRFPVQRVIRPGQDFRGYAGQVAGGSVRPGDAVLALPSHRLTRVKSVTTFDGDLALAQAPMSVTVTLEDELDLGRGGMLAAADAPPEVATRFEAHLVWMNERPLDTARRYLLKHTTQSIHANVRELRHRVDVNTLRAEPDSTLGLNAIGLVEVETAVPLFFDAYERNRATGSFILIDPESNATAGAGMIVRAAGGRAAEPEGPVTDRERALRYGHGPEVVRVGPRASLALLLERRLFERGCAVTVVRSPGEAVLEALHAAGLIAIVIDSTNAALPHDDVRAADEISSRLFVPGATDGLEGEGI
jgi:sulfate adenylyltransferase large subunit